MQFNQVATDPRAFPSGRKLSEIVSDLPTVQAYGPWDVMVAGVTTDSRRVDPGKLFVAIEGEHVDGHDYVQEALERGASCVVVQLRQYQERLHELLTPAYCRHSGASVLVVHDTREAVAVLADRFHSSPACDLVLLGITGTNGKTTVSWLVSSILKAARMRHGLIGTVEYRTGNTARSAVWTTPPAEELHGLFAEMRAAGCKAVVMEVSSHALALKRLHGVSFDVSLFTNLTQDHLDFHKTMAAYRDAKALLFSSHTRGWGLLNGDDAASSSFSETLGKKRKYFGASGRPAFRMRDVKVSPRGTSMSIEHAGEVHRLRSALIGAFNAYNLLAAFGAGILLGLNADVVLRGLRNVKSVPGRFERICSADGVTAVVDYSHTPDSLSKALQTARELAGAGRVITVFGCGGDRDQAKRPMMGATASALSDLVIITSDNPRTEDPEAIINAIQRGIVDGSEVQTRIRRKSAIELALNVARPGDIVLVAGKGHEDYQIIGDRRKHFDDREVIRNYFDSRRGGTRT